MDKENEFYVYDMQGTAEMKRVRFRVLVASLVIAARPTGGISTPGIDASEVV